MADNTLNAEFSTFTSTLPTVPEDEFCVFGIVYGHPGTSAVLEAIYAETTRLALSEPGTVYYCIARDPDDGDAFHFFERYTGRAAFEAHNSHPIIVKLLNEDGYIKEVKFKITRAVKPAVAG